MNHVAVDLGSRKSQYCVRSADGQVVQEAKVATRALKGVFAQMEKSRVVLETCSEAFSIRSASTVLDSGRLIGMPRVARRSCCGAQRRSGMASRLPSATWRKTLPSSESWTSERANVELQLAGASSRTLLTGQSGSRQSRSRM